MSTYFIGDVHGCCDELEELLELLGVDEADSVYMTGDLFDRGPHPERVFDLVKARGFLSIQSNHELHISMMMKRYQRRGSWPETYLYVVDCINAMLHRAEEFLDWIDALPFYREGEGWVMVHAGVHPEKGLRGTTPEMAVNMRRWPDSRPESRPWYEQYLGETLVIFGHTARRLPVMLRRNGRLVAAGLDTGCFYGGRLTALHLEEEQLVSVGARKNYRKS